MIWLSVNLLFLMIAPAKILAETVTL